MKRILRLKEAILFITLLAACSSRMTPLKVTNTLPTLTKAKYMSAMEAQEAIKANRCTYITQGRTYVAPIGLTVKNDLKNGARGIDEWVELDCGNAYVLRNYKWVTIDTDGSSQLHVEFDTMLCQ